MAPRHDDAVAAAQRALYALPPAEFTAARATAAATLRAAGDRAAADTVAALRRPTQAAWVVNGLTLGRPGVLAELTDLGDRLRVAQAALDADAMRALGGERRTLIDRLTREALTRAGRRSAAAALRDEVAQTFEAALADPDVTSRLGTLTRAERASGFGFGAGGPALRLVRGGRDAARSTTGPVATAKNPSKRTARQTQAARRELDAAEHAVARAETALADAREDERRAQADVEDMRARLRRMQQEATQLDARLADARDAVAAARTRRRDAEGRRRRARTQTD